LKQRIITLGRHGAEKVKNHFATPICYSSQRNTQKCSKGYTNFCSVFITKFYLKIIIIGTFIIALMIAVKGCWIDTILPKVYITKVRLRATAPADGSKAQLGRRNIRCMESSLDRISDTRLGKAFGDSNGSKNSEKADREDNRKHFQRCNWQVRDHLDTRSNGTPCLFRSAFKTWLPLCGSFQIECCSRLQIMFKMNVVDRGFPSFSHHGPPLVNVFLGLHPYVA